jgi:anti-anti-sigma factor
MQQKYSQLPKEIYHRLYWYIKKNVDPIRIAAALNLPLKTVQHFAERLKTGKDVAELKEFEKEADMPAKFQELQSDFLDIFVFSKTRYSVIDISGSLDIKNVPKFKEELRKINPSHRTPMAFKLTGMQYIDNEGIEALLAAYVGFKQMGRYSAILDPSPTIEPMIKQHNLEDKIPIFGTELAFEEHAFR